MDLKTTYMGMELKSPLVPSASPLSQTLDGIRQMEDDGAAAVVLYSLFEEQIRAESQQLDHYLNYNVELYPEALSYFPDMPDYKAGPEEYLKLVQAAKAAVGIPIIASLNGVSTGGWTEYAKKIEQAGADGLELNVYYIPTDIDMSGAEVERMYVDIVSEVTGSVSIPVAVKLSPYFSATANMAQQLVQAGADALVLFNRFYQPDFDLDELEVVPRLVLSTPFEMRLPLRWVAILYGRVNADFAITSGVHNYLDVLKGMMAGANIMQMASELLRNGTGRIGEILQGVSDWMEENEYVSIQQMQGSMSQQNVGQPTAFERANYMKMLSSWRDDPGGLGMRVGPG
jgi:dihydroorotate dehydrogenase (fumarate)